MADIHYSILGS